MHSQKNVEGLYAIGIISTYDVSLESTLNWGKDVATSYVNKNSVQEWYTRLASLYIMYW